MQPSYFKKLTHDGAFRVRFETASLLLSPSRKTEISFDLWFATRKNLPDGETAKLRGQLPPQLR